MPNQNIINFFLNKKINTISHDKEINRASVSIFIFNPSRIYESEVLLIQRAKNENDPWSGHMAFPGGRYQNSDESILNTAVRETLEEIGFDIKKEFSNFELTRNNIIPRLSDVETLKILEKITVVTPFLFGLEKKPKIKMNKEVDQFFWVPLRFFLNSKNRKLRNFNINGQEIQLPCYFYKHKIIWGITLSMIDEITRQIDQLFSE
tara:strand:- start:80 stop:697 length:618 start_codon:yes stop_codon:yes gene_type:complete